MNELLSLLEKYLQYVAKPVGERDYYDQRNVDETRTKFGDKLSEIIDVHVEEALESERQRQIERDDY